MENSLRAIFDKIPCTIAHDPCPNLEQLKNFYNIHFPCNNAINMYMSYINQC